MLFYIIGCFSFFYACSYRPRLWAFGGLFPLVVTASCGSISFADFQFAVVKRQSECGSKTAGMHFNQPMNIGVLAVVF